MKQDQEKDKVGDTNNINDQQQQQDGDSIPRKGKSKSGKWRPSANPLVKRLVLSVDPPNWSTVFARPEQPVFIDVGCAKGEVLLQSSVANPGINHLGIDIRESLIDTAQRSHKILEIEAKCKVDNVHFMSANANVNLFNIAKSLPAGSIQKVSILFPDPWYKKKHAKRRVVNATFVNEIAMVTPVGAKVYIISDVQELYEDMANHFLSNSAFAKMENTMDAWDIPVSHKQSFYIEIGMPSWRSVLVRV
ncbi:hypothetical protein SAMD00019534_115630 [Acytostelium subglobosum LB1]|uniref:hypothetical protein n=1 Tax=Acytostelium subglobosum LB1 TaxID=1410327 RepID=UPI000644C0A0|nr:hypothetical protein SAMD00019534_115630 [Acytostelium subglobosum LB1]GAM28387.1 hypothetical protein SAMD00019534_115630 [Acytostelium subglobosum LB1]|eukprot:XP_012748704.1 hypothetical protein SAMD00019534_115630 [Acytostelium subglobosum LB1]